MQALWKHVVWLENHTFKDYVNIVDKLKTESKFLERWHKLQPYEQDIPNSSSDKKIDVLVKFPTSKEANDAINILRKFLGREENSNNYFQMINGLKNNFLKVSSRPFNQIHTT